MFAAESAFQPGPEEPKRSELHEGRFARDLEVLGQGTKAGDDLFDHHAVLLAVLRRREKALDDARVTKPHCPREGMADDVPSSPCDQQLG